MQDMSNADVGGRESTTKTEASRMQSKTQTSVKQDDQQKGSTAPVWMLTVPTLQQWCMVLSLVHIYFAVKNIILLSYYYSYWDYFDYDGPGAPKFEFISFHKWAGLKAVGPNFGSHLALQIVTEVIPGTALLLATLLLHRTASLIALTVCIVTWIIRLADYCEYMFFSVNVFPTKRHSVLYAFTILFRMLEDLGVRLYITFCAWRLHLTVKRGLGRLDPKLALMPMIRSTDFVCPSMVIHKLQRCPCQESDQEGESAAAVKDEESGATSAAAVETTNVE